MRIQSCVLCGSSFSTVKTLVCSDRCYSERRRRWSNKWRSDNLEAARARDRLRKYKNRKRRACVVCSADITRLYGSRLTCSNDCKRKQRSAQAATYRKKNAEKVRERVAAYSARPEVRRKNKKRHAKWRKKNRAYLLAWRRSYYQRYYAKNRRRILKADRRRRRERILAISAIRSLLKEENSHAH